MLLKFSGEMAKLDGNQPVHHALHRPTHDRYCCSGLVKLHGLVWFKSGIHSDLLRCLYVRCEAFCWLKTELLMYLLIPRLNFLIPPGCYHAADNDLLLATALVVLIMAETTIIPVLTSALGMKATSAALPDEVTNGPQRGQICKCSSWYHRSLCRHLWLTFGW